MSFKGPESGFWLQFYQTNQALPAHDTQKYEFNSENYFVILVFALKLRLK